MQGIGWLPYANLLAQAACLVALLRRRLARRYPVFCVFLFFGLVSSAWALYRDETAVGGWLLVALYGAVAIEACVAQARHFRSLFSFAVGAIVVFAVLSAALAGTIAFIGTDILFGRGPLVLMSTASCILLMLSTAFFSTFPVTMRSNVRWHVLILQILLASGAVATGLGSVESPEWRLAAQVFGASSGLICYLLWTVKLVPSGECFMPLSEIPAEVLARLMAREQPPAEPRQPCRRPPGRKFPRVSQSPGPARWKEEPAPSDLDLEA
jgi:hypothetical protein